MMNKRGQEVVFAWYALIGIFLVGLMIFAMHQFDATFSSEQAEFDQLVSSIAFQREYATALVQTSAEYANERAPCNLSSEEAFRDEFEQIVSKRNVGLGNEEIFSKIAASEYTIVTTSAGCVISLPDVSFVSRVGQHEVTEIMRIKGIVSTTAGT